MVRTIRLLIDTEGWVGTGIRSVEHWVSWKAAMSSRRASNLAAIARRIHELPCCFALFEAGRLTDRWGRPIEPPGTGSPDPIRVDEPSPFQPPFGERLSSQWFAWN